LKALQAISEADRLRVKEAVGRAERRTSGELRVFIEDSTKDAALDRAAFLFGELGMDKTDERNGVLIYLAFVDRKYAVIGDYGIHEKVGSEFWDQLSNTMQQHFIQGQVVDGLINAIDIAGSTLAAHFPYIGSDSNELSDDIIFGK
jgi:uncharacterized membrane protein